MAVSGWDRKDRWILVALLGAAFWVRLSFRAASPNGWDGAMLVGSLDHFSMAAASPPPPGDPIHVLFGKAANFVVPSGNGALLLLNLVLSLAAIGLLYHLLRQWSSRRMACLGAGLFAFAPAFIFGGGQATGISGDAFWGILSAWLAWRARGRPALPSAVLIGIVASLATGYHLPLFFLLMPLWLLGLWWSSDDAAMRARAGAAGLATFAAVTAAWFGLLMASDWALNRPAWTAWLTGTLLGQSVWSVGIRGWTTHQDALVDALDPERAWLLIPAIVMALFIVVRGQGRPAAILDRPTHHLLAAWAVPAIGLWLLAMPTQDGFPPGFLAVLPVLYVLFAVIAESALRLVSRPSAIAVAIGLAFLAMPLGSITADAWDRDVAPRDRWVHSWKALPIDFPPENTTLIGHGSWAMARWMFPDYTLYSHFVVPPAGAQGPWVLTLETQHRLDDRPYNRALADGPGARNDHEMPAGIEHVVLMDFQLAGELDGERRLDDNVTVNEAHLQNGWRILWFDPAECAGTTIESCFKGDPS